MTARHVRASVQNWPPSTVLVSVSLPIVGDSAVVPVRDAVRLVWDRLPALAANAGPEHRFVFAISFTRHGTPEVDLYVSQNLSAHGLLATVARKLVRQNATVDAQRDTGCTTTELTGAQAERVMADLARARAPKLVEWVDPFAGVRA